MKNGKDEIDDDLRPEYDLSQLKFRGRGIYAKRYAKGTNVVLLDADVHKAFPDSESVNDALRMLMDVASKTKKKTGSPKGRP